MEITWKTGVPTEKGQYVVCINDNGVQHHTIWYFTPKDEWKRDLTGIEILGWFKLPEED